MTTTTDDDGEDEDEQQQQPSRLLLLYNPDPFLSLAFHSETMDDDLLLDLI